MKSRINKLLYEIDTKRQELMEEYSKLMKKYDFSFSRWKIIFSKEARERNRQRRRSFLKSLFNARLKDLISMPFIYAMIIPSVILDIFLLIYQQTALRLYWIPLVKRSDYIIFDRRHLDYLNWFQKFNCLYCSYVNWLFSYAVEIAWRTEKYWCPIKSAQRMKWWHYWQKHFADYWDVEWFKECFNSTDEFYRTQKKLES